MYEITKVEHLVDKDWLMVIKAPFVAKKCEPGQFMIAKLGELGERIPFTIAALCAAPRTVGTVSDTRPKKSRRSCSREPPGLWARRANLVIQHRIFYSIIDGPLFLKSELWSSGTKESRK